MTPYDPEETGTEQVFTEEKISQQRCRQAISITHFKFQVDLDSVL